MHSQVPSFTLNLNLPRRREVIFLNLYFESAVEYLINGTKVEKRCRGRSSESCETSCSIILGQIRSTKFNVEVYPSHEQISNIGLGKVPTYFKVFMESLVKKVLKQVSIGQAIVNAVKPRSSIACLDWAWKLIKSLDLCSIYSRTPLSGTRKGDKENVPLKGSHLSEPRISGTLVKNVPLSGVFGKKQQQNLHILLLKNVLVF